ncbi:MAG: tyrosine-type recombinase/integrase [Planctomycetota bacterium]
MTRKIDERAEELLAKMEPRGEYDCHTVHDHLTDYIEALKAVETAPHHVSQVHQRIKEILTGASITGLDQISECRVERFLAKQREPGPNGEKQRHSAQTSVHWRASIKAFTHWLEQEERIDRDPLRKMKAKPRGDVAKVFKRRAITDKDFNDLRRVARHSGKVRYNFTGVDRQALYTFTNQTGLRAGEIASLTPRSFDLDEGTVLVSCTASKRRRYDRILLSDSLCEFLAVYLAGRPDDAPVWPGSWSRNAAEMLRVDLEDAGIPYEYAQGRLDFHALGRHSFCTHVGHMTVSPIVIQKVCRFSTPSLLDRYVHVDDAEKRRVVEALPKVKR